MAHIHERRCVLMCVCVCVCVWGGGPGPGSVLEVEAAECAHCSTSSCRTSRNPDWITTLVWEVCVRACVCSGELMRRKHLGQY